MPAEAISGRPPCMPNMTYKDPQTKAKNPDHTLQSDGKIIPDTACGFLHLRMVSVESGYF